MKKTKKKTLICVAVVLILSLMISACSKEAEPDAPSKPEKPSQSTEQSKPDKKEQEAQIEEQVIWNTDDIKVTAKRLGKEEYSDEKTLDLLIENKSDEDYQVQTRSVAVNGIVVEAYLWGEVLAGKSANESIRISQVNLTAAGISTIGEIEVCLFTLSDDYEELDDSGDVLIETDAKGIFKQKMPDGTVVYNSGGVKIEYLGFGEGQYGEQALWFCVENTSGVSKMVDATDTSVNGFMMYIFADMDIPDGKLGVFSGDASSSELEENDIEEIKEVELIFDIRNSDYSNATQSGLIHIDVASGKVTADGAGSSSGEAEKPVTMQFTPPKGFVKEEGDGYTMWTSPDEQAMLQEVMIPNIFGEDLYTEISAELIEEQLKDLFNITGDKGDPKITPKDYVELKFKGYDAIRADFEVTGGGNTIYFKYFFVQADLNVYRFDLMQLGTQEWNDEFEQCIESIRFE